MTDPIVKRSAVRNVIGVEVGTLTVSLLCNPDVQVANVPLTRFAREGGFDGARLTVDRTYYARHGGAACGTLNVFAGRVAELSITGTEVQMQVKDDLELLNVQMPHNLFMAPCRHTLYDAGCGLSRAALTVTGNVTANSSTTAVNCNLGQAAGYFTQGVMAFTSGQMNGVVRTVKVHTTGVLVPTLPLPYVPAAGDHFTVRPGCDRTRATCNATFSNEGNFGGTPYIPAPETTY